MIAFILLCYVFVAWLVFAKFKLIPFDLKAKIATTVIGVIVVIGLNIWVNFVHPQSLDVRVFEHVVEISSRLPQPGRVVEVNVEPNVPVKAGAPLFKIDPRPYQFEVDRLAAALKEAEQTVPQLEAAYSGAKSQVAELTAQLDLANRTYERDLAANKNNDGAVSQQQVDEAKQNAAAAKNAVDASSAAMEQARIAVELADPKIDQLKAQLASANLNLEETQLVAPADGFVTNLTLKPGAIVTPGQPVMSFVYNPEGIVVASFPQEYLRGVEPDDPGRNCPRSLPRRGSHRPCRHGDLGLRRRTARPHRRLADFHLDAAAHSIRRPHGARRRRHGKPPHPSRRRRLRGHLHQASSSTARPAANHPPLVHLAKLHQVHPVAPGSARGSPSIPIG